jgi:hypothetical protein
MTLARHMHVSRGNCHRFVTSHTKATTLSPAASAQA